MQWTAEAIEDLKRLALEGRSASAIAAALGAASRNAVIGKANRIGIKLNGGGRAARPAAGTAGADRKQMPAAAHPKPAFRNWMAAGTAAAAEVAAPRRISFEDMREIACRWPLGDPRSADLVYCGLERIEGHSYCAGHCRLAYRPPKPTSARQPQWSRPSSNSWRQPLARP